MSNTNVSSSEINTFKDFLTQYAQELGISKSIIGELITDQFASKLLKMAKQYNWQQISPIFTSSISGVRNQNSLLFMRDISRGLAGLLKKQAQQQLYLLLYIAIGQETASLLMKHPKH